MLGLGNTLLGGAVSAEFTAASISSLDLWYDFSTLTGSDGDAVSSFDNGGDAGSDYNLGQSTAGRRPTLETGDMSLNSLKFDNSDDRLALDNVYVTTDQTFSVFIVFETGQSGTDVFVGGSAGDQNHIQLAGANGVAIQTRFTGTSGGSANNLTTTKTNGSESTGTNGDGDHTFRENTPEILLMTRDASEANRFFNFEGTLICTSTSATNNNSNTNFRVGNIGADGDGGGAHQGTIGEVGVYNKVLSADEISSLITHLASKWSVS
tara:strand:+ start:33 stop:827 length:795 start_codon:yes stop_codon:yes gene_type:complete